MRPVALISSVSVREHAVDHALRVAFAAGLVLLRVELKNIFLGLGVDFGAEREVVFRVRGGRVRRGGHADGRLLPATADERSCQHHRERILCIAVTLLMLSARSER